MSAVEIPHVLLANYLDHPCERVLFMRRHYQVIVRRHQHVSVHRDTDDAGRGLNSPQQDVAVHIVGDDGAEETFFAGALRTEISIPGFRLFLDSPARSIATRDPNSTAQLSTLHVVTSMNMKVCGLAQRTSVITPLRNVRLSKSKLALVE